MQFKFTLFFVLSLLSFSNFSFGQCNPITFNGGIPPLPAVDESTCMNGISTGGNILANPNPPGLIVEYLFEGIWSSTVPTYNQTEPITYQVRYICAADPSIVGVASPIATTNPAMNCCGNTEITSLQPPVIRFIESTCDNTGVASGGSVVPPTAEIAILANFGNTLQFFDFSSNSWTTTLPTYNQSQPITVRVRVACTSDLTQTGVVRDFISNPATCTPIPTMSQWGLMIFGLLTMNLGLVFLRRKEELLA